MYRNLPRKLTGREWVDRQAFNNLVDAVRVLYNIRAGGGVRVNVDSSGITVVGTRQRQRRIPVIRTAVITGFSPNGFTFFGEFRDKNGDPIGLPFPIYAFSGPAVAGVMGQQDLRDCDPKRVVDDRINILYKTQEVDDGVTIEGWWAVANFTLFNCQTADCTDLV